MLVLQMGHVLLQPYPLMGECAQGRVGTRRWTVGTLRWTIGTLRWTIGTLRWTIGTRRWTVGTRRGFGNSR